MERALVIQMETGLVLVHEAEGGPFGETAEGGGHTVERAAAGLGLDLLFHHAGLKGPGAAETPVGNDHFLDEAVLHAIGGPEAIEVVVEDVLEAVLGFSGYDDLTGKQHMSALIARGTQFAPG